MRTKKERVFDWATEIIEDFTIYADIFCKIDFEDYIPNGLVTHKTAVKLAITCQTKVIETLKSIGVNSNFQNDVLKELEKRL